MSSKKLTPEEYEKICLQKIEYADKKLTSELNEDAERIRRTGIPSTSQEIFAKINYLQEYKKYFKSFQSPAEWLYRHDKPLVLERLNEILRDNEGAIQLYKQLYQKTLDHENKISQIQRGVRQFAIDTVDKVVDHRSKVMEDVANKWIDVIRGEPSIYQKYCPYCRYEIGDFHKYTYCPNCGKELPL